AKFQQSCNTAVGLHGTAGRCESAADDLQQGAFPTAVAADDPNGFALLNFERDVLERPELPKVVLGLSPCQPLETRNNRLFQPVFGAVVDVVALAQVRHADSDVINSGLCPFNH